jgi:hypothetical protein
MSVVNKVQTYKEFSSRRRNGRFNRIHIEGEIKGGFLSKSKPFEIIVYFTNVKKIIFDIYTDGVSKDDKKLKLSFKIGDHIDKAKKWAEENGYDISFERNR